MEQVQGKSLTIDKIEDLLSNENDTKYETINIESADKFFGPEELNKIATNLLDGGKLVIGIKHGEEAELNKLMTNLKFAGFLKVSKSQDNENKITISGTKKTWKKTNKNSENPWKTMKLEDTNSELILEDELIDPFDSYQKFSKADDCITKPKPCKNCNCGRADQENKEKKASTGFDPNFKSDCGKCYLGDAFRCAGCPYRGTAAFEPGDKIEFKDLSQNVGKMEEEKNQLTIKDKKVKIEI